MQTAQFEMIFNGAGSTLPMQGVTPPEFAILRYNHQANAGKHIVERDSFHITGVKQVVTGRDEEGKPNAFSELPSGVELARLRRLYGKKVIGVLFPGENPSLPTRFVDVGVSDEGKQLNENKSVISIVENGEVMETEVVLPPGKLAPATDGTRTGAPDGTPSHLAIAVGDE